MVDIRCSCGRLCAVVSDDFEGDLAVHCRRCKASIGYPGAVPADPPQLTCVCRKWITSGEIRSGTVTMQCIRDKVLVALSADGPSYVEAPRKRVKVEAASQRAKPRSDGSFGLPPDRPQPPSVDDLLARMEERWELLRFDRARRSTELAVGIRFDVFNRDGFRCRYCGRGVNDGLRLEADHVIPRSQGGPDTLANLVTACWDCNSGKSDKILAP